MITYADKIREVKLEERACIKASVEGPIREIVSKYIDENSEDHFNRLCSRKEVWIHREDLFSSLGYDKNEPSIITISSQHLDGSIKIKIPATSTYDETIKIVAKYINDITFTVCSRHFTGLCVRHGNELALIKPVVINLPDQKYTF